MSFSIPADRLVAGHSNGRYMGSTWYCDHHWIAGHCIAHLNRPIFTGSKADHTLRWTAGLEGEEWLKEQVRKVDPAAEMMFGRIGRGGSVAGARRSHIINPVMKGEKEQKALGCSGPGQCTGGIRSTIPLIR